MDQVEHQVHQVVQELQVQVELADLQVAQEPQDRQDRVVLREILEHQDLAVLVDLQV